MIMRAPWALVTAIALAACGGSTAGPTSPGANRPPTVTLAQEPAGGAIVGVTTLTFRAQATDPDGDAVTCTWDLGDGTSRTGTSVARSYATAGSFPANVTCTDGRGGSASAGATAVARTLDGDWVPVQNGVAGELARITQEGARLDGWADNSCCRHTFDAELAHPRVATFQFRFAGCRKNDTPLTGTVSADLNRIELTGTSCNVPLTTFTFVRQ